MWRLTQRGTHVDPTCQAATSAHTLFPPLLSLSLCSLLPSSPSLSALARAATRAAGDGGSQVAARGLAGLPVPLVRLVMAACGCVHHVEIDSTTPPSSRCRRCRAVTAVSPAAIPLPRGPRGRRPAEEPARRSSPRAPLLPPRRPSPAAATLLVPAELEKGEREMRKGERGGGRERRLMWQPDMWGPRGSHAESAAT
uniref:Uncharacterized protein n=1 Tax=Oryza rufipogon TaxID=4529 RepID=A0A0E0P4N5_ORYRU